MIFKVAVDKDIKGNVDWRDPYGPAIRNRLRVDLNLADVPDKKLGRDNLGVTGELEKLDRELRMYIQQVDADNRAWTLSELQKRDAEIQRLDGEINQLDGRVTALEDAIEALSQQLTDGLSEMESSVSSAKQDCTEIVALWVRPYSSSGGGTQFYIKFRHQGTGKCFIIQGGHIHANWDSNGYMEIPFHISFTTGFCGTWMDSPDYKKGDAYGGNFGYDTNLSHASIRVGRTADYIDNSFHNSVVAHVSWIAMGV